MATKPNRSRKKSLVPAAAPLPRQSARIDQALDDVKLWAADPNVDKLSFNFSQRTGVIKVNARSVDGKVLTRKLLAPGLEHATRYNGPINDRETRDFAIRHLLKMELTQTEIAEQLGVSQALVSRVKNAK